MVIPYHHYKNKHCERKKQKQGREREKERERKREREREREREGERERVCVQCLRIVGHVYLPMTMDITPISKHEMYLQNHVRLSNKPWRWRGQRSGKNRTMTSYTLTSDKLLTKRSREVIQGQKVHLWHQTGITLCDIKYLSILIKHESCRFVCLSTFFLSHQKSQGHEILALGLLWANLDHYEARFSKF